MAWIRKEKRYEKRSKYKKKEYGEDAKREKEREKEGKSGKSVERNSGSCGERTAKISQKQGNKCYSREFTLLHTINGFQLSKRHHLNYERCKIIKIARMIANELSLRLFVGDNIFGHSNASGFISRSHFVSPVGQCNCAIFCYFRCRARFRIPFYDRSFCGEAWFFGGNSSMFKHSMFMDACQRGDFVSRTKRATTIICAMLKPNKATNSSFSSLFANPWRCCFFFLLHLNEFSLFFSWIGRTFLQR